jgi:hypothetical protein
VSVFLLSPANCGGRRARLLLRDEAALPLATLLRTAGAPVGEVFSFMSALYFRGKLTYARRFGQGVGTAGPVHVITPTRGLMSPDAVVTSAELYEFAAVDVATGGERYRAPIERDVAVLASSLPRTADVVLLGSIATRKYTDLLLAILGERLKFPSDFVGRGDMSRGALMLRAAESGDELPYVSVRGAVTSGPRATKIAEMRRDVTPSTDRHAQDG